MGDVSEDTEQTQREVRREPRTGNTMSQDAGKGNADGGNGRAYVCLAFQRGVAGGECDLMRPKSCEKDHEASRRNLGRMSTQLNTGSAADAPSKPCMTTTLLAALRAAPPPSPTVTTIDEDFPRGLWRI